MKTSRGRVFLPLLFLPIILVYTEKGDVNMPSYNMDLAREWKERYAEIKDVIEGRLREFKRVWEKGTDEDLFAEFIFCHLTPQSKAKVCWKAVECLKKRDLLLKGEEEDIKDCLVGVRFKNNKAGYIVRSQKLFWEESNGFKRFLKDIGLPDDIMGARQYLVKHVKGMGYKEASHFLRNIGFGKNIAILDRHILKNLKRVGVIDEIPSSISRRRYLDIENKMRDFSDHIGIPMDHLDLLLWYLEAGEVFK